MVRQFFGTDGIRGKANTFPMTAETALRLGQAAGQVFKEAGPMRPSVIIGKDTRLLHKRWVLLPAGGADANASGGAVNAELAC